MSSGLSQAEIDALLSGAGSSDEEAGEDTAASPDTADMADIPGIDDMAGMADIPGMDDMAGMADIPGIGGEHHVSDESSTISQKLVSISNEHVELDSIEADALGEVGNISMGSAATTLSTLLGQMVNITTPRVVVTTIREVSHDYTLPFVAVELSYTCGLEGTNLMFLQERDVKIITDLMMGGDGSNTDGEIGELHLSAISEVMNQMIGSSSTALAKLVGSMIDIAPPQAYYLQGLENAPVFGDAENRVTAVKFSLIIGELINSEIVQLLPIDFAKQMVGALLGGGASASLGTVEQAPPPPPMQAPPPPAHQAPPAPAYAAPPPPPPAHQAPPPGYAPQPDYHAPPPGYYAPPPGYGPPPGYHAPPPGYAPPPPRAPVEVHPVQYHTFDAPGDYVGIPQNENMELLLDVPLSVSVELGKSKKYIREILDFNLGSIVVLDKMAGEPVDIVVNGKLIARGEIVVIEDSYAARVTDIISPARRAELMK